MRSKNMDWYLMLMLCILSDSFEICYAEIGCFQKLSPFHNALFLLPQPPSDIDVKYKLFTRNNLELPQFLTANEDAIRSSNFDGSKDTKFIIHGFKHTSPWDVNLKDEILKRDDVNVIIVDWHKGANDINYARTVANTRVVGALIALLMKTLNSVANGDYLGRIHLIGHSLGAHVAGYAGERTHGTGRITGLEPAGPLFEDTDPRVRLDATDANFVDVIHTNINGFGMKASVGHVDFYPNDGLTQPGCPKISFTEVIKSLYNGGVKGLADTLLCSHRRSQSLFIESVNSECKFKSFPCKTCGTCNDGCANMGYDAPEGNPQGDYYLSTNAEKPFCSEYHWST
ncbi:hypothetical protein ACJMK2_042290 [Sinanodonta woodiana]|uniref:Lipase domain-containing protein n=1 Tax=Sinanodonta woodiana TaxID=1069815 RepID=A0ABD3W7W8_SINWO